MCYLIVLIAEYGIIYQAHQKKKKTYLAELLPSVIGDDVSYFVTDHGRQCISVWRRFEQPREHNHLSTADPIERTEQKKNIDKTRGRPENRSNQNSVPFKKRFMPRVTAETAKEGSVQHTIHVHLHRVHQWDPKTKHGAAAIHRAPWCSFRNSASRALLIESPAILL